MGLRIDAQPERQHRLISADNCLPLTLAINPNSFVNHSLDCLFP